MITAKQLEPRIRAMKDVAGKLKNEIAALDNLGLFGYSDELTSLRVRLRDLIEKAHAQRKELL